MNRCEKGFFDTSGGWIESEADFGEEHCGRGSVLSCGLGDRFGAHAQSELCQSKVSSLFGFRLRQVAP